MASTIAIVAMLARLPGLGKRGLWVDEAFTAIAASQSPRALVELLRVDSGPPLYYLLVSAVAAPFGIGETALRAPSAIAGIASAVLVGLAARRLGGGLSGALFAGLFVAVSPLLTHHAQDARYYAFLPLVAAGTLLAVDAARIRGGAARWFLVGLLLVVGLYLHTYGLLLCPAAATYAFVRGSGETRRLRPLSTWRAPALALILPLVLYLPWLPVLGDQIDFGATAWAARAFDLTAPLASLEAFVPGGRTPAHVVLPRGAPPVLSVVLGLVVAAASGLGIARDPRMARRALACASFSLVPMLLVWVVSALWTPVYVVGRADILFLPGLVIAAALGLSSLGRWAAFGAAAAVTALGVCALVPLHRTDVKSGDRTLARAIEASATRHQDLVIACGLTYAPLVYYLDDAYRGTPGLTVHPFPREMRRHPGSVDVTTVLAHADAELRALDGEIATWARAAGPGGRVWATLPPGPLGRVLGGFLDARLARIEGDGGGYHMGMLGTPIQLACWRLTRATPPADAP